MGFSKERQISLCIQKYATILDIEGKTLRAPYYKGGQFIKQILEEKDWPVRITMRFRVFERFFFFKTNKLVEVGLYIHLFFLFSSFLVCVSFLRCE